MKTFNVFFVTLVCFLAAAHVAQVVAMRDEREIFGHAKMHTWNRLKDPSMKVEYHNGKDEHGQTLQAIRLIAVMPIRTPALAHQRIKETTARC